MSDCIFCKIIKGELPSYKIYEDKEFISILDIYPVSKGHALVIPKKHYTWVYEVPNFSDYWSVSLKILRAIQKALKPQWMQYLTHGQIPHAHIHIIPRTGNINKVPVVLSWSNTLSLSKEELEKIAEKIRKAF